MIGTVAAPSAAPGARKTSDLLAAIQGYVQGLDSEEIYQYALTELNNAIDSINSRRVWHKLTGTQQISLLAGSGSYGLAADFKDPIHAEFSDVEGNPQLRCAYVPYKNFQLRYEYPQKSFRGRPEAYTIYWSDNRLVLNAAPESSFTGSLPFLDLIYHRSILYVVGKGDHVNLPGEFNQYLMWQARSDVAYALGERMRADRAAGRAEAIMRKLESHDDMLTTDYGGGKSFARAWR
jgi:hypothetical protein